jgi:squalene-hopene/tetraprenyl-beta-curcumene cyclase
VLRALEDVNVAHLPIDGLDTMSSRARRFLLATQHSSGGWGGAPGVPPSLEETALAVDALAGAVPDRASQESLKKGAAWLLKAWNTGQWRQAAPIGFYFANLWYFEDIYPLAFLLTALGRVREDCYL